MQKFNVTALANTLAILDIILHPIFHIWVIIAPNSYEWMMSLFVAGLHLEVTFLDTSFPHIILGTIVEASAFWLLGASIALIYNKVSK